MNPRFNCFSMAALVNRTRLNVMFIRTLPVLFPFHTFYALHPTANVIESTYKYRDNGIYFDSLPYSCCAPYCYGAL